MPMFKRILKSYDYAFIAVFIVLCLFGLIMIYSASWSLAIGKGLPADYFYARQVKNFIISFIFFILFALLPFKFYQNNKVLMLIVFGSIGVLLLIFLVGKTVNNANSWLVLGPRSLQPGEFAKLAVIIYMSAIYAKKQSYIDDFNRGVLPPIFFLAFICFLIAIQPDTGTAFIIFLVGCCIIITSGMRLRTIMKLIGIGMGIIIGLTLILFALPDSVRNEIVSPTKVARITTFMNPFEYADKEGHQLINSFYAIGSGGVSGQGLGESVQKLGYLPEAHTDFIIAVVAEELGVFGVMFIILALFFIIFKTITTGLRAKDPFASLMCYGIASLIAIQAFINLGGASGLIPLTGVTLPFISYGGSSLMVLSMMLGIVANISMFTKYQRVYKADGSTKELPKKQKRR